METFLLKGVDLFKWLFVLINVDHEQLRSIVSIKLIMDNRRQVVVQRRKDNKEPGNTFIRTLIFYSLFGLFVAWAFYAIHSFMPSMIMFFSYIMVMIAMTLITDFSSVLLDTSDNTIILPRPVDGRTLFVARLIHIMLYLGQLAAGLSLASVILVIVQYGVVFGIFFIIGIIIAVFTALFITNAIYLLIMQFASEEKLKNIINYFQILMAVVIMGGYQLLPRMLGRLELENYVFEVYGWKYLIPPIWIAGALESFHFRILDGTHTTLIALAIIIPISGVYLVSKYLTPVFTRKLGAISGNSDTPASDNKKETTNLISKVSHWVTQSPFEQGTFEAIYKIIGRDRKIKLKIYPAYGYVIIFGLIFMLRDKQDFVAAWQNLPNTQYHLMLIYLTFMVIQVALYEIPYSDEFKASWIYFTAPLDKPGEILSGMLKAILVRIFIPGYFAISVLIGIIWGIGIWDDLLFGLLNNFIMLLVLATINKRYLPLSVAPNTRLQTGNLMRGVMTFVFIGILGVAHFLLSKNQLLLLGAIPLQVGSIYLLLQAYRKTPWSRITL